TERAAAVDDGNVVVQLLPSGTPKVVVRGGYDARYVPSGHLLYIHSGTLFAMAFDPSRLESLGSPMPVLDDVTANSAAGSALYSVSDTGVLVYLTGGVVGSDAAINWL